jgi:hypothetical protein
MHGYDPSSTVWPSFKVRTPRIYGEFEGFLSSRPIYVVPTNSKYLKK